MDISHLPSFSYDYNTNLLDMQNIDTNLVGVMGLIEKHTTYKEDKIREN